MKRILILAFLSLSAIADAHEGSHHGSHTKVAKSEDVPPDVQTICKQINEDYAKTVKPIFESKCAACHSKQMTSPWYSSIPGVGWIVEGDRTEAKVHLEISGGFPFAGHGTPEEDLKAIREAVTKNTMPTKMYSIFHPSSGLSENEKNLILTWTNGALKKIGSVPK